MENFKNHTNAPAVVMPANEQGRAADGAVDKGYALKEFCEFRDLQPSARDVMFFDAGFMQRQSLPDAGLDSQKLVRAFDDGWHMCTKWAKRDDLLSDMGSRPYTEGRDICLAAIATSKATS